MYKSFNALSIMKWKIERKIPEIIRIIREHNKHLIPEMTLMIPEDEIDKIFREAAYCSFHRGKLYEYDVIGFSLDSFRASKITQRLGLTYSHITNAGLIHSMVSYIDICSKRITRRNSV